MKTVVCLILLISSNLVHAQDPSFYIFLCFGQSNMEGQGTIESQDRTVDDRFQVFQSLDCSNLSREKGKWYPAVPPLTRCWTRLSPADYFGRTLVNNLPDHIRIGIINVSVGGCRLELFDKDIYENYTNTYQEDWFQNTIAEYEGNPYQYLVNLSKEAQKDGVVKGILLHQGESNNGDAQWPNKVKKIYEDLVTDLDLNPDQTPLLAGELVHEDQNGQLAGMNDIINQLPQVLDNSYVISSSGCTDQEDNIHFNAEGYRELGKRYAEKMLELLDPASTPLRTHLDASQILKPTYPNPAEEFTTFHFILREPTYVTLRLLDLAGKEVDIITTGEYTKGSHAINYNLSKQKSGTYIYQLKTSDGMEQQKIIIK